MMRPLLGQPWPPKRPTSRRTMTPTASSPACSSWAATTTLGSRAPPLQPRLLALQGRRPRRRRTRAREQARSGGEAPRRSRGKVARLLPGSSGEPISAAARRDFRRARSRQATGDPASSALRRALRQAATPHLRRPRAIRTWWMPGALGHRERTGSWLSLRSRSSSCTRSTMSGTTSVAEIFLACCGSTRVSRWPSSSRSSGSTSTRIHDPTTL
mmetsp:Transcript_165687/g.531951  ORF Transcript_165687/g.531951 Transcript_165687/m.531951 type:complete len:214 (-) Transcript_165687:347-988(-)